MPLMSSPMKSAKWAEDMSVYQNAD